MPKANFSKLFLALLVDLIFIFPVSALLTAWVCSSVWSMFLVERFGASLTRFEWIGVGIIVAAFRIRLSTKERTEEATQNPFGFLIEHAFMRWTSLLCILGASKWIELLSWML